MDVLFYWRGKQWVSLTFQKQKRYIIMANGFPITLPSNLFSPNYIIVSHSRFDWGASSLSRPTSIWIILAMGLPATNELPGQQKNKKEGVNVDFSKHFWPQTPNMDCLKLHQIALLFQVVPVWLCVHCFAANRDLSLTWLLALPLYVYDSMTGILPYSSWWWIVGAPSNMILLGFSLPCLSFATRLF